MKVWLLATYVAVIVYVPIGVALVVVTMTGLVKGLNEIVDSVVPPVFVAVHVALAVISTGGPPETVAAAVKVVVPPANTFCVFGEIVIAVTLLRAIVIAVVPVIAPWDAVIFAVPGAAPVTKPPVLISATDVSSDDQKTPLLRVLVLPSSKFPIAAICNVLPC